MADLQDISQTIALKKPLTLNHFVFAPINELSHLRLTLKFALNLLEIHPSLIATFIISKPTLIKYEKEIARQSPDITNLMNGRWRLKVMDTGLEDPTRWQDMNASRLKIVSEVNSIIRKRDGRWGITPCLWAIDVIDIPFSVFSNCTIAEDWVGIVILVRCGSPPGS
jgi:hypothetical protein